MAYKGMPNMKSIRSLTLLSVLFAAVPFSSVAFAHEGHNHDMSAMAAGELVPASEKDAAWIAEQKAKYPTNACIVSGDKLGADMGKPVDFVYRVAGKPDRLVTFCCKDCVRDFNKDPEKYLKVLDEAAGKSSADAHAAHQH